MTRVTIKDIARHTELSVSTVSLVLNNKVHRISEQTRKKVLQAANELGYRPNQLAKGLVTKRTNTVGLIIPDVTNVFFSATAKIIQAKCRNSGYNMFLCNTNDDPEKDIEYINALTDRGVDGVLLAFATRSGVNKAAECCEIMSLLGKPLVLIDRTVPNISAPSVLVDHETGGYLATRHLLELGHRKIGCIAGPMSLYSSKQRFYGYIRALQEFGVAFDPALVQESEFHILSDYGILQALLERQATAIFAYNDLIAYGVYQQALQHGLMIPRDFSLVGFDDQPFSKLMGVPLTTVSQPVDEMCETAASLLLKMMEDGDPQPHEDILFPPRLVKRESAVGLRLDV